MKKIDEDDLPLTADQAKETLAPKPKAPTVANKARKAAKPKSPPIVKENRGGERENAGRPEGTSNKKYTVRAEITRIEGNVGNWITKLIKRIEKIDEPDKQVKAMMSLLPYLVKIEHEEEESKQVIINDNLPDFNDIKAAHAPAMEKVRLEEEEAKKK
jgi:hypothetical protein